VHLYNILRLTFKWELSLNNTCRSPLYNGQYDIVFVLVQVYAATSFYSVGYMNLPVITTVK